MAKNINLKAVPKKALVFVEDNPTFKFAENEDTKELTFEMVAYSGGPIKNHYYWGDLWIDLEGMKFDKQAYPILADHDTDMKIGVAKKSAFSLKDGNIKITSEGFSFLDTPHAEEFKKLAQQGFPYQSSIYARPSKIQRLMDKEEATVNGKTVKGPDVTIWREATFFEASIVVFGADSNTNALVFNDAEEIDLQACLYNQEPIKTEEVKQDMDLETLKKDHPDLVEQIKLAAADEIKNQFSAKIDQFSASLEDLKKENANLKKQEAIRNEKDMQFEANTIWQNAFADSGLPERLFSKIKGNVSYSSYVAEDKFDKDKFKSAVEAELKDWADMGISDAVLGGGSTSKSVDENAKKQEKFNQEVDTAANALLKLAGCPIK